MSEVAPNADGPTHSPEKMAILQTYLSTFAVTRSVETVEPIPQTDESSRLHTGPAKNTIIY